MQSGVIGAQSRSRDTRADDGSDQEGGPDQLRERSASERGDSYLTVPISGGGEESARPILRHIAILTDVYVLRQPDGATGELRRRQEAVTATIIDVQILAMTRAHADAVLAIYQAGIDEGDATFETAAPNWAEFDRSKLPAHRFVAIDGAGTVLGWAAVVPVSDRCVYAGVVEHSVYVASDARGRGVGRALLDALVASTESAGIWTVQSGIFPENTASLALHRAAGFREVGRRERIGEQHGVWRDVVLVERRSPVVGHR